jgi:hypothetical protein
MTNEKFTLGEWEIEERQARVGDMELYGFAILTEKKRICMCQTDDGRNIPQMKANAALIAAAPEMYRCLQGICFEKSAQICQYAPESCKVCRIGKNLKKARGEE